MCVCVHVHVGTCIYMYIIWQQRQTDWQTGREIYRENEGVRKYLNNFSASENCVCMCVCVPLCVCVCLFVSLHIYMCVCVRVKIFMHV